MEDLIGARLIIGIPGTKITPEIISHFKELHAGGLILYRINFENPSQLKKLITELENALERKILVVTDHEGGRVIMFREGVTIFPDNLACGLTGKIEYAKKQGAIEAKECRRLGLDVNLGPVLDVLTESYSPNIGIRSYGCDWKLVSEMGAARISAMQKGGLSACAKHFPGKGRATVDAHLSLPTILSTWKEMEAVHLKPFIKAIETGVHLIMTSHPYYPNLDPEPNMIATFSKKIVQDYLRNQLGFKGVISSDDLEMGAVKEICSIETAAIRATKAGHDILLVCHNLDAEKKVFYALLEAYKSKELDIKALEKSVERIEKLKAMRKKRFEGGKPHAEKAGKKLVEKICLESVQILAPKSSPFTDQLSFPRKWESSRRPRKSGDLKNSLDSRLHGNDCSLQTLIQRHPKGVFVIFPKFSSLAEKITIEKEVMNEEKFLRTEFGRFKIKPKLQIVSIEPTDSEIQEAAAQSRKSDSTIFFCYDAHLYPSNKKLLESLQANIASPRPSPARGEGEKEISSPLMGEDGRPRLQSGVTRQCVVAGNVEGGKLVVVLLRDPYDSELVNVGVPCITDFGWRACQIKACIKRLFA